MGIQKGFGSGQSVQLGTDRSVSSPTPTFKADDGSLVRSVVVSGCLKVLGCFSVVIVLTHNVFPEKMSKLTYSFGSPVKQSQLVFLI